MLRAPVVALSATLLVVGAGCGSSSGPTIPGSRGPKLVLQRTDLPKQFAAFYFGRQLMADQTPGRTDPTRFGREGGWIGRYKRAGSMATAGPLVLVSRVDLFKSADGAKKDLQLYRGYYLHGPGKEIFAPKIGDESIATVSSLGSGSHTVRTYSIAWRQSNATAQIEVNGFARKLSLADAVAIARKQERRLKDSLQ